MGSSFQLLQAYEIGEQRPPLVYYAFDVLFLEGADLRKQPLTEGRKQRFGEPLRRLAETRTRDLPLCKPPGEETREMEPRRHARNHETLPLG